MPYEYSFMVQTVQVNPQLADADSDHVSQSLGALLGPLGAQLSTLRQSAPGGPSEIVSHNMTRIGQHLVLTLLTRREK